MTDRRRAGGGAPHAATRPGRWTAVAPWVVVALAAAWIALALHMTISASDARDASARSEASAQEAASAAARLEALAQEVASASDRSEASAQEAASAAARSEASAQEAASASDRSEASAQEAVTASARSEASAQEAASASDRSEASAQEAVTASARSEASAQGAVWRGGVVRDCSHCPEMVVVPPGSFDMGSPDSEEDRDDDEGPVHEVTIQKPFAVGIYEVTRDEWNACVSAGGDCRSIGPTGLGRRPVVSVSWDDARSYIDWLSENTGKDYRLLSESEWEYVARARTVTRYWWGDYIDRNRANCDGCGSRWDDESVAPVGSFGANPFGLHDVHGNVREWVQDCWNESYRDAPGDGSARKSADCSARILRGGSWAMDPRDLRAASRTLAVSRNRHTDAGFRVAREVSP